MNITKKHIIDLDADSRIPYDGWKVEEHKKGGQFAWNPAKVALFLSKKQQDGQSIEGNKLREEMVDQPVYNANLLDYLLDNPHLIPEEWKGKAVFFWGTIYRDSDGSLYVCYLVWRGGRWLRDVSLLDSFFVSGCPSAVAASPLESEPKNLSSDTLTSAIQTVKDAGYIIYKEI